MIYLDNAATTVPKPPGVLTAVQDALENCGNMGRGGHKAASLAAELAYSCRCAAADLFEAEPDQVVFTMNATHGLNIAIRSLIKKGDRVVVSGFEHNAVLRVLYAIGAEIVSIPCVLFDQKQALSAYESALTADTKAVIINHVSNVFGFIQPLEQLSRLCQLRGIPLIIDAAQSAGVLPLSLKQTDAAFIAMPGHKGLYGPAGTGLLLCKSHSEPLIFGGTGSNSHSMEMPSFLPDRLEAGTQNIPGIAGLLSGIRFVQELGVSFIASHELALKELLVDRLKTLPNLHVFSNKSVQTGVVSFYSSKFDCETIAQHLAEQDIAVRAGLHCAPLAHKTAGTFAGGTVRVSFSVHNTAQEVEKLFHVLRAYC